MKILYKINMNYSGLQNTPADRCIFSFCVSPCFRSYCRFRTYPRQRCRRFLRRCPLSTRSRENHMYRLPPFIFIIPGLGSDDCDADGVAREGIDVGSAMSVVPASSGSDGSCTFSAVDSLIPAGADDSVSAKKTICVSPSCVTAILALTAVFSCVTVKLLYHRSSRPHGGTQGDTSDNVYSKVISMRLLNNKANHFKFLN